MNLASLTILDHVRGLAVEANDITDFMELEECVSRYGALAEDGIDCGLSRPLLAHLSEAVEACDSYMAARSRESSYEGRLRDYCAERLQAAAALCGDEESEASEECGRACRTFLRHLGPGRDEATTLWN